MRKLDVLIVGVAVLVGGGGIYTAFQLLGIDTQQSGIWASALLAVGLLAWTASYLTRVLTGNMSIHQQSETFKTEVLRQTLESMSAKELAQFEAELEAESGVDGSSPQEPPLQGSEAVR